MSPELQQKLTSKWPEWFSELDYGIECSDGWYDIIARLCQDITPLEGFKFTQIKEKFASIRVYYNGQDDAIDARIDQAELESEKTCERCGSPGKIRGGSWLKTLCEKCHDERR